MKFIYASLFSAMLGTNAMASDGQIDKASQLASMQASSVSGSTVSALVNDHIPLGTAYDSQREIFLNVQPVAGRIDETFGNTELSFKTGIDMSYEDILSTLAGSVDVDVNFPVVRVSAGASMATEMASSTYSSSYTFSASSVPKKRLLLPNDASAGYTLSTAGNEVATNHQSQIQELVGDEFVYAIEYGANLLVNLKIEYGSNKDKSDIGGYLDVDLYGGVFNVGGELKYLQEETKSSVKITVRAVQRGGDPKQLLSIIPNNIITCSLENPAPCFDMFKEAVDYSKNQFQAQLQTLDDYNVVNYYMTRYDSSSLALKALAPAYQDIRYATKLLISDLEEDFQQALMDEHRASELLTSYYAYLPEAQRNAVEDIKQAAYDNAWFFYTAADYCRDNPFGTSCEDSYNAMKQDCAQRGLTCPQSYDITQLQLPTTTDLDWKQCEMARQEAVRAGVILDEESTIYRNMRWAPTFIDSARPALGILNWRLCEGALNTYGDTFSN
ncbi:internalin [uncultured Shewanella sp.]|uniref:internalin n=1 Tax=uncultured Shewanella sp. TaxID=173975 RepID=UPI002628A497|nr:internalin [uncultured Shewanella sp.]